MGVINELPCGCVFVNPRSFERTGFDRMCKEFKSCYRDRKTIEWEIEVPECCFDEFAYLHLIEGTMKQ